MRRVQIRLEEELDRLAAAEAARRGVSKAALIRISLAKELAQSTTDASAWKAMTGWLDVDPVDDIEAIIYGPTR